MRKKYTYCEKYSSKIERYLAEKGIKYKIVGDNQIVPKMISFMVYDNNLNDIVHIMKHGNPIITNEFTKKEIQSAEYLSLRAVKQVVEIVNAHEAFLYKCQRKTLNGGIRYEHKEQIGELITNKAISTKEKTCFFSSSSGFSELFVKESIYALLQKEGIKGVSFLPVNVRDEDKIRESGLLQISAQSTIRREVIRFSNNQRMTRCPICGRESVICRQDYQLQLADSPANYSDDFYMTDPIFGEGFSHPLFVISKNFYSVMDSNKLTSNIVLEPVLFEIE